MERSDINIDLAGDLTIDGSNNGVVIELELDDRQWELRAIERPHSAPLPLHICTYELVRTDFVTLYDDDANQILQSLGDTLLPLLARIRHGHSIEWNGNTKASRFTPDADFADRELRELIEVTDFDLPVTCYAEDFIGEEDGDGSDYTAIELLEMATNTGARIWGGIEAIEEALRLMQVKN